MTRPLSRLPAHPLAALGLVAACAAGNLPGQSIDTTTHWAVVKIAATPVGWSRSAVAVVSNELRADTRMRMVLNRLGKQVVMETSQRSVETLDGKLREIEAGLQLSEQRTTTRVTVTGARATIASTVGGRAFRRTIDLTGELRGTEGVRRLSSSGLHQAGDSIRYLEWDPQAGAVATVVRRLIAIVPVRRGSATVSARKVLDRSSTSPVPVTQWLDPRGVPFRMEYEGPFGLTETVEADSAQAMLAAGGGSLPEEQYARTIVRTQIKLPRARELDYLRLALRATDSAIAIPGLNGPGQREVSRAGGRVVLEIRRRRPRAHGTFPVPVTAENREYLEPNAYIQSDQPALVALARRVVGTERDLFAAASKLERWVADSMHFDLGVVFAPSVEVFQRRRGTCVAYATLLATLTRSIGIPSRIAMGYVYVNGMFGGHAWPEILIGDEWIDLDGAIVADGPADAARFAFAWSSLATGPGSLSAGAASALYGHLEATVEAFGAAGMRHEVPPGAAPYVLSGDRYRNPWLGLEIGKPASFRFTDLDATWPAMTVVALAGGGGEKVKVTSTLRKPWTPPAEHARAEIEKVVPAGQLRSTTVSGRAGWIGEAGGRAALAIPAGAETWVIEVDAPDPAAVLERLLATTRLGIGG